LECITHGYGGTDVYCHDLTFISQTGYKCSVESVHVGVAKSYPAQVQMCTFTNCKWPAVSSWVKTATAGTDRYRCVMMQK
jgi:hypothetical protein